MTNQDSAIIICATQSDRISKALVSLDYPLIQLEATIDVLNYQATQKHLIVIVDKVGDCQYLRENDSEIPILVINDDIDKALDAGADDCHSFNAKLLPKRVESLFHTIAHKKQTLSPILNVIPDVMVVINQDGRFTQVISTGHQSYSHNIKPAIGKILEDVLRPYIAEKIRTLLKLALDTQTSQTGTYNFEQQGKTYYQQLTLSPINKHETVVIARDITQQKLAEESLQQSENRYRRLFKNASDAILVIDVMTGKINDASPQASWLLGYTLENLVGMSIDLIESDEINIRQETKLFTQDTNQLIVETQYKHQDGHLIDVEINSRAIQDEGKLLLISFVRDISEHKRTLAEIEHQRNLAEALLNTANALNQSNDIDTVLDQILNNVSRIMPHESANIMMIKDNVAHIIRHLGYDRVGIEDDAISKITLPLEKTDNLRWVADNKQSLKIDDTHNSPYFKWVDSTTAGYVKSLITAPIIIDDKTIGFINIDSAYVNNFTEEQTQYLMAFANQSAIAVQHTSLIQKLSDYTEELETRVAERTQDLVQSNKNLKNQIIQRQLVEEKLEEERLLLRILIDNIPDHIYVKDTEQKILVANRATLRDLIPNNQSFDDIFFKTNTEIFGDVEWIKKLDQEDKTLLQTKQAIINQEYTFTRTDGEERQSLVSKIPLIDAQNEVIGFLGINRDVTDLKKAQAQLSDERNMLRLIIDTIPDSIYVKNRDHQFILANKAAFRNIHNAKDEAAIIGKTDKEIYPEIADRLTQEERHIMTTGAVQLNQSEIYYNDDGSITHLLVTKLPLKDSQGAVKGIIGVNHNITELRQAEVKLKQVLESARCLVWSATVGIDENNQFIWDYTVANEEAAQNFLPLKDTQATYTQEWLDAIPDSEQEKRQVIFETHLKFNRMNYRLEYYMELADGEKHWLSEDVLIERIDDDRLHLVGVCTDITSRKQAEIQLKEINDELESRVSIRTKELTDEIIEREKAEEAERYQRRIAEVIGAGVAKLSSTLDLEEIFDHLLESIQTIVPHDASNIMFIDNEEVVIAYAIGYDKPINNRRYQISEMADIRIVQEQKRAYIIPDVQRFNGWQEIDNDNWIRTNIGVPIILDDEVIGLINLDSKTPHYFTNEHAQWLMTFGEQAGIAIRNARYTAELEKRVHERTQALELEQAQLNAILNGMTDGVMYTDTNRKPQYINQALTNISGFSQEEWVNGVAQKVMNTEDQARIDNVWANILKWLETHNVWQGEKDFQRKDGSMFDASMVRTSVRNQNGEVIGIVTVISDISDEKQLKEQKARFITVAAHELRTPITNMKTRLFLMKRQPEKLTEHLAVTESVVNLMQNLVEHMFDLSRFERGLITIQPEPISIQDLLEDVLQYQAPQAERQEISIELEAPITPIVISADPFRLTQVVINLIGNALNYTPQKSTILISVKPQNKTVIISFKDNGSGIEPEHIPNLFQPFYRASNDNKGAGLGLSIVNEIVKAHQGKITVESEVGLGTTFLVHLPMGQNILEE